MTTSNIATDFQRLLPHRPPMLMLTRMVSQDKDRIHCISIISADNPLLRDDVFPVTGGIELLAQAGGTLLGAHSSDTEARPGAIVQIKSFKVVPLQVPVNAEVHIHARYQAGNSEAALVEGEVSYNEQCFFSGTLMIALFNRELE